MATVNVRESLHKLDEDTSYKYDLLTMYDSCPLLDNDKKIIARMLYDKEDPEVIYDRLQLYLDDDIVSDLDTILDIDTLSKGRYESFINHCVDKLAEIYDYVQYNEDIDAIQITQGDKIRNIKVNVFVNNKLNDYQVAIDECNYDIQTFDSENDAIDYVVSIVNQRMNDTDEGSIDDEIDCCSIYNVVENNGELTAKGIIESTNELKDIDLGKINTAQANELLNSILNNPNYKVSADTISKINNNSAPWGLAVQMVGSVDVDATNGLLAVGDIGGDMSVAESVDKSFNKGSKVTDGRRNGTVLDYDSEKVLVDWDYSDTDDIEWIDKKKLDLCESANESIYDIETKTNARKLVDKAKSEGKKLSMRDAEEVVDQSFNNKYDNIDDFYKKLDLSESAVSRRYVWFDYDDINDVKPAPQQIIDAYNVKYPDYSDPLVHIQQIDFDHRSYPKKELHYIVTDNQGNKFWAIVGNIPESKLEQILESHEDDLDPKQPSFKDLMKNYKNYTTFKDIEENSGLIRDLCDDLENKGVSHYVYNHVKDNGITIFYDDFDVVEDFDVDDIVTTEQEFDSAATSINSNKLPAIYKLIDLKPGSVVVDFGGGKFDNAVEYLKDKDVTLLVYDPYNRSADHNKEVLEILKKNGGADAAINSNVLNVIKEPEARNAVLQNIKKITKKGAPIYITVYEGTGKGNEGPTKSGYQLNRKTSDYIDEISQVFSNVNRKGKLITAINESLTEDDKSTAFNDKYFPRVDINNTSRYDTAEFKDKFFAYDKKNNVLIYLFKDDEEVSEMGWDNAPWRELDSAGLSSDNWNDEEARNDYLYQYTFDLDSESSYLAQDFIDNELPYYQNKNESFNEQDVDYELAYVGSSIDSLNNFSPGLGDACKRLKDGEGCSYRGYDVEFVDGDYNVYLSESKFFDESLNENLSPEEGDRVRMDHYTKSNKGQEGTVTGRIGELCWVTWDDGTKSKEIKGYLTVIERDGRVVNESVKGQLEIRKQNYLKAKEEFDTLGEKDNNDVLSREEKMLIAKAEYEKALGNPIDESHFYTDYNLVEDLAPYKKEEFKQQLQDELYDKMIKLFYTPEWGYENIKEIDEFVNPIIDIEDYKGEYDNDIKVEFRAELNYPELEEICNVLDKVIQKYDKQAYFEPVEGGIADAFITLPKDLKESVREYTNKLLDMVDEGIVDKDILIRELLNYMSEDDVKDFVITNEYDD